MLRKNLSFSLAVIMAVSASSFAFASDLSGGTPWIDSELDGAVTEEMQFELKDDFAAAVNRDWILQAQYPTGKSSAGTTTDVVILVNNQLTELVTGDNTDDDPYLAQVQGLYGLYMDWDSRNEAGITPLMPMLNQLEKIHTLDELNAFLCLDGAQRYYLSGPFRFDVLADLDDSSRNILTIDSADLFLEDSAEYLTPTEYGLIVKEARLELFRKLMIKAGYSEERIEEIIFNALAYETAIAQFIPSEDERNSPDYTRSTNNRVTRDELQAMQGDIPLISIILAEGVEDSSFTDLLLTVPTWFEAVCGMYTDENVPGMRDAMILSHVVNSAELLDQEAFEWNQTANNTIEGNNTSVPAQQAAITYVQDNLSWPLSRAYVSRYFTQQDKDRIALLCADVIAEYKLMLQEEDFLSAETIAYACEKLDNIIVFSLYPDDDAWPDTSALTFNTKDEGGSFWDAVHAISNYQKQDIYSMLGMRNDRTRWNKAEAPTLVNAAYDPSSNVIMIYAAICNGAVYNSVMSDEEMYATIGGIVGHEISHAFDSSGAQYDKVGNMSNWWPEEDYTLFQAKNQKLMDYYSSISPWEGQYVHGNIVSGEACADMAGIKVMLHMAKSNPNFDYDLFFRTFANLYKRKCTMASELNGLTNVHPLNYLRINVTLIQQEEFVEFYGIREGDGMYIAPDDRIAIW